MCNLATIVWESDLVFGTKTSQLLGRTEIRHTGPHTETFTKQSLGDANASLPSCSGNKYRARVFSSAEWQPGGGLCHNRDQRRDIWYLTKVEGEGCWIGRPILLALFGWTVWLLAEAEGREGSSPLGVYSEWWVLESEPRVGRGGEKEWIGGESRGHEWMSGSRDKRGIRIMQYNQVSERLRCCCLEEKRNTSCRQLNTRGGVGFHGILSEWRDKEEASKWEWST